MHWKNYMQGADPWEEMSKLYNNFSSGVRNMSPPIADWMDSILGKESVYDENMRKENERYWEDYQRNTGVEAKYPYRTGAEWNNPIGDMGIVGRYLGGSVMKHLYGGMS